MCGYAGKNYIRAAYIPPNHTLYLRFVSGDWFWTNYRVGVDLVFTSYHTGNILLLNHHKISFNNTTLSEECTSIFVFKICLYTGTLMLPGLELPAASVIHLNAGS